MRMCIASLSQIITEKKLGEKNSLILPITVSKLMTCERKYAFEPCCMLFASLIRGLGSHEDLHSMVENKMAAATNNT